MSDTGNPPYNLQRLHPAESGLLMQGCVMKIMGGGRGSGQVSSEPSKRFVK